MDQGMAAAAPIDDGAAEEIAVWDLGDLYAAPNDAKLGTDLDWARNEAALFRADYSGRLAELSGAELARAIARYEAILERLHARNELRAAVVCGRHERGGARPLSAGHAGALQ